MTFIETMAAVVAGGGITTTGQAFLERYRVRRSRESEVRTSLSDVDAARRQIVAEVWALRVGLRLLLGGDGNPEAWRHLLDRHEKWDALGSLLAQDDRYINIDLAYSMVSIIDNGWDTMNQDKRMAEGHAAFTAVDQALDLLDPDGALRTSLKAPRRAGPPPYDDEPDVPAGDEDPPPGV